MAHVELQVRAALSGATTAGARVFPLLRQEGAGLPAIVYTRAGTEPVDSLGGSSGLDAVRVQLDCYAQTFDEVKALAMAARPLMESAAFKGLLRSEFDAYEPDTKIYRVSMDFACWQKS